MAFEEVRSEEEAAAGYRGKSQLPRADHARIELHQRLAELHIGQASKEALAEEEVTTAIARRED